MATRQQPSAGAAADQGSGAEAGWAIFGYLLSGMAFYGGIGWLVGRWAGNPSPFLAGGMIIGLGLAIALVIFRYGRS